MKFSSQSGFTIIEVMLVLAVSSSLLLIGFVGRGQIREQTQFTDGVERLASSIKKYQSEATSTVGKNSSSGICDTSSIGKNIECINLGVLVDFHDVTTDGVYQYQVSQIVADRKNDSTGTGFAPDVRARNPRLINPQTITPSWGIKVEDSTFDKKIAFIRHSGNGQVETIVMDSSTAVTAASLEAAASTNTEASLDIYDVDCNHAVIIINPSGKVGEIKTDFKDKAPSC
jgi:prepilin-type N-terminal cleavage/methylation domain-containing protein